MQRIKLEELNRWYNSNRRKPLVIWGARQVGKTYLVKDLFAKQYFKDYLYIDLKKDDDARSFFSSTSDPSKYLRYIEARYGKKLSSDTPLIFDEVQLCSPALSSLKYFQQDYPAIPVIATGSLVRLSILHHEKNDNAFLFPVGKINSIHLYPIGFEEYLLNTNKTLLDDIRLAYMNKKPLEQFEHELAMDCLFEFLSIGGLPEVVDVFIKEKSYVEAGSVLKEVYSNYLADMDTYNVSNETILKTRNVYKNIFSQLNKENRNFKISQVDGGKSNRDYFNAYQWLELANVVYRSRKLTGKVTVPIMEEEGGLFRLYLADEGMFSYQSNLPFSDFYARDKRNTLGGIFYENYVADEFAMKEIPLYYWTGKNSNEFEFVVDNCGKILPIDVKKGTGRLNSLNAFRSFNPISPAIKISSANYGYDSRQQILTIPLYEVFLLADDIAQKRPVV